MFRNSVEKPSTPKSPYRYLDDDDDDDDKYFKITKSRARMQLWIIAALIIGVFTYWILYPAANDDISASIERKYREKSLEYTSRISQLEAELSSKQKSIPKPDKKSITSFENPTKISSEDAEELLWDTLPSSDVWCKGDKRSNRVCKFRNLCYMPDVDKWIISKTKRSVIQNVPFNASERSLLETSTVENHNLFFWDYTEINPFSKKFQHLTMRYETAPHFIFSRLHPKNIMHNIHDDLLGMFFLLKEYIGLGHIEHSMPFSIDTHRILIIDAYGHTETTRPLQYLSQFPIRFKKNFLQKNTDVVTCFRDAIVGNSKVATFYQYGFDHPQGKLENKELNGMYIREVSEWILRRLSIKLSYDEEEYVATSTTLKKNIFGSKISSLDLKETDAIVILIREHNRLILNQQEFADGLKLRFGLEVIMIGNQDTTFEHQINILRRARVVIAMHGSILIMTMFCHRGTVVIEMFPFGIPSKHYTPYKTLAELEGMDMIYKPWENPDEKTSIGHPDNHELNGGISHLSKEMQEKILNTKTVPQHLCCSSPYWLYRIYQDTVVDIAEIGNLIQEGLDESRKNILSVLFEKNWQEASFIKPATIDDIVCVNSSSKEEGFLWAKWQAPWNEGVVTNYNIRDLNSGQEYVTRNNETSIYIGGFKANETVSFHIRAIAEKYKGPWGRAKKCKI